ncbi:MAG: hypothetical protein H6581_26285 [Bacteroidia bacterium]|nr:hypothetical protein [Bacteroidia bacterium]
MAEHLHNDTIEELLRQYLLKQDGQGGPGESLLQQTAEKVFESPPEVSLSAARKAEMLSRLKADFPPQAPPAAAQPAPEAPPAAQPGPGAGSGWLSSLKLPLVLASVGVIALTVTLLVVKPKETNPASEQLGIESDVPTVDQEQIALLDPVNQDENPEEGADQQVTAEGEKQETNPLVLGAQPPKGEANKELATTVASEPNESAMKISYRSHSTDAGPGPVDQPSPILELFAQTTVPSETKTYFSGDGTLFVGSKGTLIHVPPYAFVKMNGEEVKGNVQLEVKEVYTKSDYILSNLPTNYKNKELVSGGVIMVEATAGSSPLKLAPGKDLYVEFSRNGQRQESMQLYAGEFDPQGNVSWTPAGGKQGIALIPLPLDVIDYKQFVTRDNLAREWNSTVKKLASSKYENTFIATREFVERLVSAGKMAYNAEILNIYLDNLDKNLWEVDFMVAEKMRGDFSNWQGKTGTGHNSDFDFFAEQKLGRVNPFHDYGINLDLPQAYHDLVRAGIAANEADRVVRLHHLRKQITQEFNSYRGSTENSKQVSGNFADSWWVRRRSCGFSLKTTGWCNLDQVMTTAPERTQLTAVIPDKIPLEATRTFFLYNSRATMISGKESGANQISFHSIPQGSEGMLVTLGYFDGQPYWGEKLVGMDVDKEESMTLEAVSLKELEARAREINIKGLRR